MHSTKTFVNRGGITKLELLVCGVVLLLLAQLALPLVVSVRDRSRRSGCQEKFRVLYAAIDEHCGVHGHLPSGGWTYLWAGDPNRGVGAAQPGGWSYNILPYLGHAQIHDLALGLEGKARLAATNQMLSIPLSEFFCPARRAPKAYSLGRQDSAYRNFSPPEFLGKSDYAANAGDLFPPSGYDYPGPPSLAAVDDAPESAASFFPDTNVMTGVFYPRSETRLNDVIDGLAQTYLLGEKYVDARRYTRINCTAGDDLSMYQGYSDDTYRWAGHFKKGPLPPMNDRRNYSYEESFGSAHSDGCNFLMCDGSVKLIAYDIDVEIHQRYANRRDTR